VQVDLIIVGGGAAGLWAAARSAECGCRTLLLEKNNQVGVKILMSGGTRCNITHATDHRGIADAFATFDKKQAGFLRSALATMPPEQVIELIEAEGVATKIEETGKIFPVSNRAIDVRDALLNRATDCGAQIQTDSPVVSIRKEADSFVVTTEQAEFSASRVLITSGGQSYPGCGTTGDGYAWAKKFGHTIVNPVPALTPITTNEDWITSLKGITLPDASISVVQRDLERESNGYGPKQFLDTRRSSLLLTHFGFSGPAALDLSRVITRSDERSQMCLVCDFVTTLDFEPLLVQLSNRFRNAGKKNLATILPEFVPRRLAEAVIVQSSVLPDTRAAELSKRQIRKLAMGLKSCVVPISGTLGFRKAEVTAGGVSLAEVDSRTMQSKLVDGLYFAGEVLDIDGPIGGFNFQAAFSTGWLAGESAVG
jgi:predicted Rossmann fold flavoprotein